MLKWIFMELVHWNNGPQVDMSLHSDTSSWFQDNQSLFLLVNDVYLAEKQRIQFYKFLVWPKRDYTMYHTLGQPSNYYTIKLKEEWKCV